MSKQVILKIKELSIIRDYGFNNGGKIVVGHFYKNHKPVKDSEDIVFSSRGTIVEDYAISCGIKREDHLHKLVGKEVGTYIETEYSGSSEYDVEYLTRPFSISKKMGLDIWQGIVGELVGDVRRMEDVV